MAVNEDAKKLTSKRTDKALADFSEAVIEADSASLASISKVSVEFGLYEELLDPIVKGSVYTAVDANGRELTIAVYDGLPDEYRSLTAKIKNEAWTTDKVPLSKRLHGTVEEINRGTRKAIKQAINENKAVTELSKSIYSKSKTSLTSIDLPEKLNELTNISKSGLYNDLAPEVADLERYAKGLKTKGLRNSYSRVAKAVDSGNIKRIDSAIEYAIRTKGKYLADRVAITEMARSDFEGETREALDDPDVVGMRYTLSGSHKTTDICDGHCGASFGFGAGVYPIHSLPNYPFHPFCGCNYTKVFSRTGLTRSTKLTQKQYKEGGNKYISGLSDSKRAQVIGVGNAQKWDSSSDWRKQGQKVKPLSDPSQSLRFDANDFKKE